MKVPVSAYACEPGKGSEPEVGWQWVRQIARFHEIRVITHSNNRENIEKRLMEKLRLQTLICWQICSYQNSL